MPKLNLNRTVRSLKLGKLTGRVGASYLGQKVKKLFLTPEESERSLSDAHKRNAQRIATTLGELKGAVMKLGQMASLQSDLLPPEITGILSGLQNAAQPMDYQVIKGQIEQELGSRFTTEIVDFEEQAFASASIGQVHRGTLRDGRRVAIKVQYPDIDGMLEDDLRNLRLLFKIVAQTRPGVDLDLIFEEIRSHLIEELDYLKELENLQEFQTKLLPFSWLIVPNAVPELTTHKVLTMELIEGLPARELNQEAISQETRNLFTQRMAELFAYQILKLRILHADPNLANFALDGSHNIILYDFGCVKRFPKWFIESLHSLIRHGMNGEIEHLGQDLLQMGMSRANGDQVEASVIEDYAQVLLEPFTVGNPFNFGDSDIHTRLLDLGFAQWRQSKDYLFPRHIVFINRVLSGMYGYFMNLSAQGQWGEILTRYLE